MASSSVPDRGSSRTDFDIVIVGSGMAGLACAIRAANHGASVALIEKQGIVGGTTWLSGGNYSTANSRLSDNAKTGDSVERFYQYVMRTCGDPADPDLVREIVEGSGPTLDWMIDLGLEVFKYNPPFVRPEDAEAVTRLWVLKGAGKSVMQALIPAMQREIDAGHIDLRLHTTARRILRDDRGAAVGLEIADQEGAISRIDGRHIVIAGGGYGANREMIAKTCPGFENALTLCPPAADGASILLAQEAGAAVANMDVLYGYPGGLPSTTNPWRSTSIRNLVRLGPPNIQGAIVVNTKGKRVISEESSILAFSRASMAQWDKTLVLVFDSNVRASTSACPISTWDWEKFDHAADSREDKQVIAAASWEELASRTGIDAEALKTTIAVWNACADSGTADEFGRMPRTRLDTPPYYAVIAKSCLMVTLGGVRVNGKSQVLDLAGAIIPNLYAIGEVVGMATYVGKVGVPGFGDVAPLALGKGLGERLGALMTA